MPDVSVAYDRIFNFVAFRNHLLHFYLSCPEHLHEGGPQEPPTLQQAVEGQRQLDRALEELGSQLIEEFRVVFREMSSRAEIFSILCLHHVCTVPQNLCASGLRVTCHTTLDSLRQCL